MRPVIAKSRNFPTVKILKEYAYPEQRSQYRLRLTIQVVLLAENLMVKNRQENVHKNYVLLLIIQLSILFLSYIL